MVYHPGRLSRFRVCVQSASSGPQRAHKKRTHRINTLRQQPRPSGPCLDACGRPPATHAAPHLRARHRAARRGIPCPAPDAPTSVLTLASPPCRAPCPLTCALALPSLHPTYITRRTGWSGSQGPTATCAVRSRPRPATRPACGWPQRTSLGTMPEVPPHPCVTSSGTTEAWMVPSARTKAWAMWSVLQWTP